MNNRKQLLQTYKSISDWHGFRLRLFAEGILTGAFAGLVISFFRFALHLAEEKRMWLHSILTSLDWTYHLSWFAALIVLAFVLNKLNKLEPLAAGSGIPQVKGAILGLIKMRWFSILWVKLTAGILGIGAGLSLGREGIHPARRCLRSGHQPSFRTYTHGGALSYDQRRQRRLSRRL